MAFDGFVGCYADHVGQQVDAVAGDLGQNGVNAVVNWWQGLNDSTQRFVVVVAGLGGTVTGPVLTKILNSALGEAIGVSLVGLAGGAARGILIKSMVDCGSVITT
jgi:hypothetical protein